MRITLLACLSLLLFGCLEDTCEETITYQVYQPVVVSAEAWRSETFATVAPTEVCDASGFYVYGDYLFVLDRGAGLQVYDNRDNDHPEAVSFVAITGGQGLAVRNDILYVNQYVDLLAFDLSDPTEPTLLSRTEDVFAASEVFAYGSSINAAGNLEFILDYVATDEQRTRSCQTSGSGNGFITFIDGEALRQTADNFSIAGTSLGAQPEQVGQGGSLARFTIARQTLYVVESSSLKTFSLSDPAKPTYLGKRDLGWGIETIFPYGDQLFIGAENGMHIYGISNPEQPQFLSTFEHVRSCDPVVVQNDLAYVTMWGGSDCGDIGDRLMVLDVSDARSPRLLQETRLNNSHGLGIDEDKLFLCSGPEGLQVFDLDDKGLLGELRHAYTDINAKDVIVRPDRGEAIVFGWYDAGISQLDYTRDGSLTAVSRLETCR